MEEKANKENLNMPKPLANKILNKLTQRIWALFNEEKITSGERETLLTMQEELEKKIIREMQNELNDLSPENKYKYYF